MKFKKKKIPIFMTVLIGILVTALLFGSASRLINIIAPDKNGDDTSSTEKGPFDSMTVNPSIDFSSLKPFGGKIPEGITKIEGSVYDESKGGLSLAVNSGTYEFVQNDENYGYYYLNAGNDFDYLNSQKLIIIDFDLNLTVLNGSIDIAPAFCYFDSTGKQPHKPESLGNIRITADKKIYTNYSTNGGTLIHQFTDNEIHLTFAIDDNATSTFPGGSALCIPVYCYANGVYIGKIASYQYARESKVYFNGLKVATIKENSLGNQFTVSNLEMYGYSDSYNLKSYESFYNEEHHIYNNLDWCYYQNGKNVLE